jgi:serine/threonine protein kinase
MIHEGGMGEIYRARHRFLNRVCIVKAIRTQLAGDADLEERFLQEARAATELQHPNIAEIYDFFVAEDGRPYIVMELIDGRSLADDLRDSGPPPLPIALDVARQVLRALAYMHSRHFVHRDISPDNLMLAKDVDGRQILKMIDLGIVKSLTGTGVKTQTGTFLGKPLYAAPEQFGGMDGRAQVDERSDLYSLGVVLYELLTNTLPITGRDHLSVISGHLLREPLPFSASDPQGKVPEPLRRAVLKALAKSKDERFQSAAEFSAELGRCAAHLADDEATRVYRPGSRSPGEPHKPDEPHKPGEGGGQPAGSEWPRRPTDGLAHGLAGAGSFADQPTLLARTGAAITARRSAVPHGLRWAVAATAAVAVLAAAGLWIHETGGRRQAAAATAATTSLAPTSTPVAGLRTGTLPPDAGSPHAPAASLRTLAIDASPWAKVVAVERSDGTPVDIGWQRFTPLAVALAPGSYRITLEGGSPVERRSATVAVPADAQAPMAPLRIAFPGGDADSYLATAARP